MKKEEPEIRSSDIEEIYNNESDFSSSMEGQPRILVVPCTDRKYNMRDKDLWENLPDTKGEEWTQKSQNNL